MNCAQMDSKMQQGGAQNSIALLEHIDRCSRCRRKYSLTLLLTDPKSKDTPGEQQFLSRLMKLGKQQSDSLQRAQELHSKVQEGDRLFWRGEYDACLEVYRDALMLVRDRQGRVALLNKLARVQMHRHRARNSIETLNDALHELGEPTPPKGLFLHLAIWKETLLLWWTLLSHLCRRLWPQLFRTTTQYGDRSRAAQHLYRELSILAQSEERDLSQWAHLRELHWAVKLQQPLELIVAWGRHAVRLAQRERFWLARNLMRKVQDIAQSGDLVAQAAANFYIGRVAFLHSDWERAREHLEECVRQCETLNDECLREAALQHLIRVYRNDGSFEQAVHGASELLSLYHQLENLPRLSACCRHFALIYASYGDLRHARSWAFRALDMVESDKLQHQDRMLSLLRCYVLLADLELRSGRSDLARRYLSGAIAIQREHHLPPAYFRDGVGLLRQILGAEAKRKPSLLRRLYYSIAARWAVMRGDLTRAQAHKQKAQSPSKEQHLPSEFAYLFQEYTGEERQPGLRKPIAASRFALAFLQDEPLPQLDAAHIEADGSITNYFPVGAVSSRWGRGALSKDRTGIVTTQFSNTAEAPWGYFFADDIG